MPHIDATKLQPSDRPKPNPDLNTILEKHGKLESDISDLLTKFKEETTLSADSIHLWFEEGYGFGESRRFIRARVDIKLQ
jgi:hypothetical protein